MRNNENNIIFNVRNITLNLRNITTYFTGKEKIITLVSIIIMLSFINIILCSSDIFYNSNVSALTYQTSTNIGFTFLPTLNVSLSSDNLTINNLVPGGNAVDSNTITINVSTNIAEGYNLFATVGDNNNTNNGYNIANLVNTADNNYTFAPLSSNIPNLNSFTNDNWGYSYCISNCSSASTPGTPNPNWISGDYDNASTGYNGLPLYTNTGIKLVEKADSTNSTVNFKIAAKASNTQPSGEYTNVINFTVISNTIPTTMLDAFIASGAKMHNGYFKMQDMTPTICKSIDTDGEKGMQLIDVRDDKVYWVAKLKDGNCWMTQNLDLCIGCEGVTALTSENTDINPEASGKGIYNVAGGYSESGGVWTWTPANGSITSSANVDYSTNTVTGWDNSYYSPMSAEGGDTYFYTSGNTSKDTRYDSLDLCKSEHSETDCLHYSVGNYYNWTAAIASNSSWNIASTDKTRADNSICPKGWRLPNTDTIDNSYNEFGRLFYNEAYSITNDIAGSGNMGYKTGGFNALRTFPLWFVRSGSLYYYRGLLDPASYGYYWSSTASEGSQAYYGYFGSSSIYSAARYVRSFGMSIRCIARQEN